ncbi:hypothetical protein [Kitasatospora sp. NPDC001132]
MTDHLDHGAAHSRADAPLTAVDAPLRTSPSAPPCGTGPGQAPDDSDDGTELVSRRPMSTAEAIVVIAFLIVGAVLLVAGKPIMAILGLFAGVGAIVVAVLARRIPKITWR